MPTISITISDAAAAKLQALVDSYNAQRGTALTPREWIILHLRELVIGQELSTQAELIQRAKEQETADAIAAKRNELLAGV